MLPVFMGRIHKRQCMRHPRSVNAEPEPGPVTGMGKATGSWGPERLWPLLPCYAGTPALHFAHIARGARYPPLALVPPESAKLLGFH